MSAVKEKFSGNSVAIAVGLIMFMHLGAMATSAVTIPAVYVSTGIPIQQILIMVTVATVVSTLISLTFATPLMNRIGAKWCLLLGSIFVALHFFIYATTGDNPWPLYIGSVFGGLSLALGTKAAAIALVGSWFIEKRARMLGFIFGISSVGAGLWQVAGGYLIDAFGVHMMWIIMGIVIFVVAVGANLLFVKLPDKVGQKPLGWEKFEADKAASAAAEKTSEKPAALTGIDLKAARKTASLWMIYLAFILAVIAINTYRTNLPTFLTLEGWSTVDSSNISGIRAVLGALFLVDKIGLRTLLIIMMGTEVIALIILGFSGVGVALVIVSVALSVLGAGIGGAFVGIITNEAFGNKDFAAVQTFIMSSTFVAGAVAPLISSGVLEFGGTLELVNIIMAIMAAVCIVLFLAGLSASPYVKAKKAEKASQ